MFEFDEKRCKEGLMKDALTPNENSEGGTRECQKEKTQTKVVVQESILPKFFSSETKNFSVFRY